MLMASGTIPPNTKGSKKKANTDAIPKPEASHCPQGKEMKGTGVTKPGVPRCVLIKTQRMISSGKQATMIKLESKIKMMTNADRNMNVHETTQEDEDDDDHDDDENEQEDDDEHDDDKKAKMMMMKN
ncbi:hypothetical protein Tco_0972542 [Tanacetum coccineum]